MQDGSNQNRCFDAIVIGSGLGGLAAAAKSAHAGNRVLVLERNRYFGGAACTYSHAGLQMDASLHQINGVTPFDPKMRAFEEWGITKSVTFISVPNLCEVRGRIIGAPLGLPLTLQSYCEALIARFPHKGDGIEAYVSFMERLHAALSEASRPHGALWWLIHGLDWLAELAPALAHGRASVDGAFRGYFGEEEGLKSAAAALMEYFAEDPEALWFIYYAAIMASYIADGGAYVKGGSGALAHAFVQAIEAKGGTLLKGHEAVAILMQNGRAAGVMYKAPDGSLVSALAPIVFGNAAPAVLSQMLPETMRAQFLTPYAEQRPSNSLFTMDFGLREPPARFGVRSYATVIYPDWQTSLAESARHSALLAGDPGDVLPKYIIGDHAAIDSGLRHSRGRSLLTVTGVDRLANWDGLDEAAYARRKALWLHAIVKDLDRHFPGLAAAVDWKEMATARTMAHFLNTPHGEVYGFAAAPPAFLPSPPRTATSVPGLYLASAYTVSGGFTGAIMGGLMAAQAAMP